MVSLGGLLLQFGEGSFNGEYPPEEDVVFGLEKKWTTGSWPRWFWTAEIRKGRKRETEGEGAGGEENEGRVLRRKDATARLAIEEGQAGD